MKAVAVYPAKHAVKIVDIAEPRIAAPTQVKLRMLEVGVCGTDKDICAFAYGTPPAGSDRFVLGHESLAEVVETGPGVADLRAGDLVVSTVRLPCTDADCVRLPRRPLRFLHDRQLPRTRHQGAGRLHDRIRGGGPAQPAPGSARPARCGGAGGAADHRGEGADRGAARSSSGCLGTAARIARWCWDPGPVGLLGAMALVNAGFETYVYSRSPKPNAKADVAEAIGARYISSAADTHRTDGRTGGQHRPDLRSRGRAAVRL